jgi:hypothetical protein
MFNFAKYNFINFLLAIIAATSMLCCGDCKRCDDVIYKNTSKKDVVFSTIFRNEGTGLYFFDSYPLVNSMDSIFECYPYYNKMTHIYILDIEGFSDSLTSLQRERPLDTLLSSPYILAIDSFTLDYLNDHNFTISYPK